MFDHLLIPLDGSPLAESVLVPAAEIARRANSRVSLLHVIERAAPATVHGARHLTQQGDAQAYLAELSEWFAERNVTVVTEVRRAANDVANVIAQFGRECGADIVLLCTHGSRGVRGLLFGRVAQQVLAHSQIPVFLFPAARSEGARSNDFELKRIVLPLDGTHDPAETLAGTARLATTFGASVLAVTVVPTLATVSGERAAALRLMPRTAAQVLDNEVEGVQDFLAGICDQLTNEGVQCEGVVGRGDPFRILGELIEKRGGDAIVMPTHGRAGMSVVWTGSVASRLLEHTPRPVLLFRVSE